MDPEAAREHLRTVRLLAQLADDALDAVAAEVKWIEAARNETVVKHLDPTHSVFFIVKGACKVKLTGAGGRAVALRPLKAGDHFGEIAALTDTHRSVQVSATADCLLAEFPRAAFDRLMGADATFARSVAASLARLVVSLTERVFELAALDVRGRVCAELLRRSKYCETEGKRVLIRETPTHETIAAMIGSQREEVTRKLGDLCEEGLIHQDARARTLVILDIDRLRDEVRNSAGFLWDPDEEE
jgi:CRP-like cAMP-binding protein